jgi:hypothetical protein
MGIMTNNPKKCRCCENSGAVNTTEPEVMSVRARLEQLNERIDVIERWVDAADDMMIGGRLAGAVPQAEEPLVGRIDAIELWINKTDEMTMAGEFGVNTALEVEQKLDKRINGIYAHLKYLGTELRAIGERG